MGSRDYRWREPKKPKRGSKKVTTLAAAPQLEVEVIRKGKKKSSAEE